MEKRNQYALWVKAVRAKIDHAAEQLNRGKGMDGETVIAQLRNKLHSARAI